tara:strand:+ start:1417 stop:1806 length:390 start_codon:yes stop_codon:yes gene_type:complete
MGEIMGIQESITTCMSKYATFQGRASRSEFWWFYLFAALIQWFADITFSITLGEEMGQEWALILSSLVSLIFVVPLLAAIARRLHDTDKSGWRYLWVLTIIGIIPVVVWLATEGSKDSNEYGESISLNS